MADPRDGEVVKPFYDDPFVGHLSTPISDSPVVRAYINNLPAYRRNVAPLVRGVEIGLAHGFFLFGPETLLGPLRETDVAYVGGLLTAIAIVLVATVGMSIYGIVSFQTGNEFESQNPRTPSELKTAEGWSQLTAGFFLGGMAGAFLAFFLFENFDVVDSILRGIVNNS
ncbi:photosystem I reaction center protein subunit XI [Microcoleus sp. FACHB-SPT15]|jgi:photosystem I subunit 11|uniref:photosystem I reaction center protein subunit XI n=1 Tax=Microcoleus sp. FACHB-SPT15 TaxID=2692830 RepID=UPI001786DAB8|nr:photosystem I reaction center protein subunit XI [Microcoleus sp. FACHB-SPT15]MBD1808725.1 photosystem I reaction center protein subunit XI [Microcoleus sp. FACHB-SPT15]